MIETRHVDMLAANSAIVPRRCALQRRQITSRVQPDLLAQVTTDHIGSIAEAVRVPGRFRVQQDARRVDTACAQDNDLSAHLLFGAGASIEILDAGRAAVFIGQDPRRHRVRSQFELARFQGERQQVIR